MIIVNIAPNSPYNENWGYQENLLPKYQARLGHEVFLIVSNTMHENGAIVETECGQYRNEYGVTVIRKKWKKYAVPAVTNIKKYIPIFYDLVRIKPDFIFFHGLASDAIYDASRYKRTINPDCIIVQDNHFDYNIGRQSKSLKQRIVRAYDRFRVRQTIDCVEKVYGVTPWRKVYAEDYYLVPNNKTDVLLMGADDEKIDFSNKEVIRNNIRKKYKIDDRDFLIVSGGKIDCKKHIDDLMSACKALEAVKLLIFGSVDSSIEDKFNELLKGTANIIYIGWIPADSVYDIFFAADLVFFPGQHSVLWEQACACKVPCVFYKWEGMDHVDNGGNSSFINSTDTVTIAEKITELNNTDCYKVMLRKAESEITDIYLYSSIAKKSIECAKG